MKHDSVHNYWEYSNTLIVRTPSTILLIFHLILYVVINELLLLAKFYNISLLLGHFGHIAI